MDAQVNALSEDALCSLLDRGVTWLEEFDTRLKSRAADLERKEADLAHRMELAEQLERDFAERERRIADARAQADEFARRLADQEHALRTREQQERGEVRTLREQYDAKLRELEDRDAALKRMEAELTNRRRAVEVCESAIARFQQTFERVLDAKPDAPNLPRTIGGTHAPPSSSEPRSATANVVLGVPANAAGDFSVRQEISARGADVSAATAMYANAESWGEWQGPMR